MKKLLIICLCLFTLCACVNRNKDGEIKEISMDEVMERFEQKKSFVLLVSREKCIHCQEMEAMLEKTIGEHNTVIYNIVMDDSSVEALNKDIKTLQSYVYHPDQTPHVYYVRDGIVVDDLAGYNEENDSAFWDWIYEHNLENQK